MSIPGFGTVDPFRGLRELPSSPDQLRHHLSHIHHTLQHSYFVDADTANFVLQPEQSEEFALSYVQEVEKIFHHLSKVSRRQIKVRVNPHRYRAGYEVVSRSKSPQPIAPPTMVDEDPTWTAHMTTLGRKLQEAELLESARQDTPDVGSTPGMATSDSSDVRVHKNSFIFSTPPEFKGFTMSPDVSPAM